MNFQTAKYLAIAGAFVSAGTSRAAGEPEAVTKPNILFIFADDLGWGDLSCHGHPHIKTPHIDRLAAEGTDYHLFTVAGPSCSPSRTGLMTGLFPARFCMNYALNTHAINISRNSPDFVDAKAVMLPRLLKGAGYATAHFGKWHLSNADVIPFAPLPVEYGYDRTGVWNGPGPSVWEGIPKPPEFDQNHVAAFSTEGAVMQTVKFIEENRDRPFFVNLWIHESHTQINPTAEQKKDYMQYEEPFRSYYACVANADRLLGGLFDRIRELGLEEKTIIIFSSDNGPETPEENQSDMRYYSRGSAGPRRGQKRSLFQGGTGVPFIAKWKGRWPSGRVDETHVLSALDMLPTFCELAGVDLPDGFTPDGESITALLRGDLWTRSKPLFWYSREGAPQDESCWPRLCVQRGTFKLYFSPDSSRTELYNIAEDRSERTDLSARYPEKVTELKKELLAWEESLPEKPDPASVLPMDPAQLRERKPGKQTVPSSGVADPPHKKTAGMLKREQTFTRLDKNKDMQLTPDEFPFPGEERLERFRELDRDGDGVLSKDEFINAGR